MVTSRRTIGAFPDRKLFSAIWRDIKRELALAASHELVLGAHLDQILLTGIESIRLGTASEKATSDRTQKFVEWQNQALIRDEPNAVYMDTTSLHTMKKLLSEESGQKTITPLTLIDLGTFVYNLICYDRILHLETDENFSFWINERLGNEPVAVEIPVKSYPHEIDSGIESHLSGIGAMLGNLMDDVFETFDKMSRTRGSNSVDIFAQQMARSWSILLNHPLEIDHVVTRRDHFDASWDSNGPYLLQKIISASLYMPNSTTEFLAQHPDYFWSIYDEEDITDMISECNIRSDFNHRLSSGFEIPYSPGVSRFPYRHVMFKSIAAVTMDMSLRNTIDKYIIDYRIKYNTPSSINCAFPSFLAIVLNRSSSLSNILDNVCELRKQAYAFRKYRSEYEEALSHGKSKKSIDDLRNALSAERKSLISSMIGPVSSGIAATLAALNGETGIAIIALIGILATIQQLSDDQRILLTRRLFRPNEWFLVNMADEAKNLTHSLRDVQRLWHLTPDEMEFHSVRMKKLRDLNFI